MKICIYGTGAVGGAIGSVLSNAGHDMTFIARGEHLKKMQEWGLQVVTQDGTQTIWGHFTNLLTGIETPDYLFVCVKAFAIPEIEESINRLTGPNTIIIPVLNGIPWWYFRDTSGPLKDYVPKCLDPEGNLEKFFPHENVIGSVVYTAAAIKEPGIVTNLKHPPRLVIGETTLQKTDRINKLGNMLEEAGFKSPICENIRSEIWLKLCWNIAFNPIATLTGMTGGEIVEDKETREAAVKLMREMETIANHLQIPLNLDVEERMNVARKSGSHKPSMLQDFENGKKMETEAIVGAVVEVSEKLDIAIPNIVMLYDRLKNKEKDLSNANKT